MYVAYLPSWPSFLTRLSRRALKLKRINNKCMKTIVTCTCAMCDNYRIEIEEFIY
jgi:hypothetical protein